MESSSLQHQGNLHFGLSAFLNLVLPLSLVWLLHAQRSALTPVSLLKLLMEIYNRSSLTTPFSWGLLPGSIKSNPDGLKMCFLLPVIVICLFISRKDKFWLREVLLAVNNAIKNKSEAPAWQRVDLCRALCGCQGMGTGPRMGTSWCCPTAAPWWVYGVLPTFMSLTQSLRP